MGQSAFLDDPRLRHFIDRARVDCDKLFEFACPMYWGGLQETDDPAVRHCDQCQQDVYFTSTAQELIERSSRGQCVAVMMESEVPDANDIAEAPQRPPVMMLGRVNPSAMDRD